MGSSCTAQHPPLPPPHVQTWRLNTGSPDVVRRAVLKQQAYQPGMPRAAAAAVVAPAAAAAGGAQALAVGSGAAAGDAAAAPASPGGGATPAAPRDKGATAAAPVVPGSDGFGWFARQGQEVCVAVLVQQLLSGVFVTRVAAMSVWPSV